MKNHTTTIAFAACAAASFALLGCGGSGKTRFPSGTLGGNPVAERVATPGGDELVVADIDAFGSGVSLPLSMLAEELEIIRLDSRDEALFDYGKITLSDNYIGIATQTPRSFKLFDRSGKYLHDIGHEGRGPSEYRMIYSTAIDEATETVYILPWQTDRLLAFGLDGSVKEPVKLAHHSPKGVFNLNADGTISVAVLPMRAPVWAWTQDMAGNVVNEIANPHPELGANFSSEISYDHNSGEFNPFLEVELNSMSDTLSRYDTAVGRMQPLFTIKNILKTKPSYYGYGEMPHHFFGYFSSGYEQTGEIELEANKPMHFLVDKQTLQGTFYELAIDELGGLAAWPDFSQGYYVGNFTAIGLKKELRKLIDSGGVTDPETLKRVTELEGSLTEDDNNVLLLAKLKR